MNSDFERLIENYVQWLRSRTQLANLNGIFEITTPFIDRHNDRIQIYAEPKANGDLLLHDDGYTISDLELSGCSLSTPSRSQMLNVILKGHGVEESGDVLTINATRDNFPQKKHSLLQAILAVNDMFLTAKHQVARFFLEDVASFLDDHTVRYLSNVTFQGRSGFNHRFDFAIPKSNKSPERLVRAINHPNKDAATNLLFAWTDTKETRSKDSQVFAILNDTERSLNADVLSAFRHYDVQPILWSERDKYAEALAA